MTPAAIALSCGFMFSPPASWDAKPLPVDVVVVEVPLSSLKPIYCPNEPAPFGCERNVDGHPTVFIPTWETWRKSLFCYEENMRHELAHAKGWKHP